VKKVLSKNTFDVYRSANSVNSSDAPIVSIQRDTIITFVFRAWFTSRRDSNRDCSFP